MHISMDIVFTICPFIWVLTSYAVDAYYIVFTNNSTTWNEARHICHSYPGGSLLNRPPPNMFTDDCIGQYFNTNDTYWLGLYTSLTPFITHQGCYHMSNPINATTMAAPSVGYCYRICSSKGIKHFGIMVTFKCVCISNGINLMKVSKRMCTQYCPTLDESVEYCGGKEGYLNIYHIKDKTSPNNLCGYISCTNIGHYEYTNCSLQKGRICHDRGHPGVNRNDYNDQLSFNDSRQTCKTGYLQTQISSCQYLLAGVHYWLDIKQYQYKEVDQAESTNDVVYRCFKYRNGLSEMNICNEIFLVICVTDTKPNGSVNFCPILKTSPRSSTTLETFTASPLSPTSNTETKITHAPTNSTSTIPFASSTAPTSNKLTTSLTPTLVLPNIEKVSKNKGPLYGGVISAVIILTIIVIVIYFILKRRNFGRSPETNLDSVSNTQESNTASTISNSYFILENQPQNPYDELKISVNDDEMYIDHDDGVYDKLHKSRQKMNQPDVNNVYSVGCEDIVDSDIFSRMRQRDVRTTSSVYDYGTCSPYTASSDGDYGRLNIGQTGNADESDYDHV